MIWRHLFGYMPARLVGGLASFGGVYVFTRLLTGEEYGQYALVMAGLAILQTLTVTWAEAAAYRFSLDGGDDKGLGFANHVRTSLGLLFASMLVSLILLGVILAAIPNTELRLATLVAGVSLLFAPVVNAAQEMNRAQQRVARFSALRIVQDLGTFVIGALLAWRTGLGAAAPFAGLACVMAVLAIVEGTRLIRESKGGRFQKANFPKYARYGFPIAAALVLHLALDAGDRFLIAHYLGAEAVGAYAAGYGVADKTVALLCGWAAAAGAPLMLEAWERDGPAALKLVSAKAVATLMLVGAPAATGLALVAVPLSEVMIGVDLRSKAAVIIPWIALSGLLAGLSMHYASEAYQLSRRTDVRAWLMVAPAILNVVLNVILLPRIGLMGAVYATVACYSVALIMLASVGRKFAPLGWPLMDILKTALACAGMSVIVLVLPEIGGLAELGMKAVVGGIVYAALVYLLDAARVRTDMRAQKQG